MYHVRQCSFKHHHFCNLCIYFQTVGLSTWKRSLVRTCMVCIATVGKCNVRLSASECCNYKYVHKMAFWGWQKLWLQSKHRHRLVLWANCFIHVWPSWGDFFNWVSREPVCIKRLIQDALPRILIWNYRVTRSGLWRSLNTAVFVPPSPRQLHLQVFISGLIPFQTRFQ